MMKDVLSQKKGSGKKAILLFLLTIFTCYASFAQNRQITGTVTSSDNGSPLPGVSIKIKGATGGAVTDINGSFKISAPENATLIFSYIGYATQQIAVGTGSVINVKLSPDINPISKTFLAIWR